MLAKIFDKKHLWFNFNLIVCLTLVFCFWLIWIYSLLFQPRLIVVWLQNNDEIRATGGFLGSVVWLETRGVFPQTFEVRDIYEVGGHLRQYIAAPPPVARFLSGGGPWRLQDSNWDRDFPTSAQRFSDFLVLADFPRPDLIVALNLNLMEQIIDQVGGIVVEHRGQPFLLTSANFYDVARARRPRAAPYDFPKMDLLRAAKASLMERFKELSFQEKIGLLALIHGEAMLGNIQFFSPNFALQTFFVQSGVAGNLIDQSGIQDIYIFDSNVGINKINRFIDRQATLTSEGTTAQININWQNFCSVVDFDLQGCTYGNYFRIILDSETTLVDMVKNGEEVFDWDEREVVDGVGQVWREIGFLMLMSPMTTSHLEINLIGETNSWNWR
ncbi:MAG: DUF4012 domain-containing protein [Pseudomonadales bacterium]|nr:DUF4012 domain-containing protein [Pseudomonadales bacterium]